MHECDDAPIDRLLAATVVLAGCALTRPVKQVPESGFLGDYSQLHKGAEGQAEMVYIRPGVDWKQYNRMLLDPVTIWRTLSSSGVSQHDAQLIADYFYRTTGCRAGGEGARGAACHGNWVSSAVPWPISLLVHSAMRARRYFWRSGPRRRAPPAC